MKHVIRKQLISLQLAAGHDAFSIQQSARDYFYDQVAPALDKVLTELSSPNEMISLDRVEIDLGNLHWKNEKLIANSEQLYQILKQSLSERLSATGREETNKATSVTVRTRPAHACGQWLYYMENGVLPWALQHTPAAWLEQVLHQLAIDHQLTARTKDLLKQHRWFLLRVVRDHSAHFLQQLAGVLTAKPQPGLPAEIDRMASQMELSPEYQRTKHQLWSAALLQFAAGKTTWQPGEALPHLPGTTGEAVIPEAQPSPLQEGIFCAFAGVVLLHPFFKHLFNHLSLLENGLFINEAAKAKAVLLIYYAATGNTNPKDHELAVAKTLCGMPLWEVLEAGAYALTEPEKEETGNMLHAAIAQWTIINNTSAAGLREGFLSRPGKLFLEQTTITFTLETSGIDVLLDHLPWNLSIIKFPWLNQLIRVEWR
ncbi:hypothetical protein A3860_32695 [Niastella vici]|uniref:Uncharacterized protein n=1 Tax=Niastella vici TaxID=1703345 RepID=A0A1V9FQC9_9BACT|nr:contractile injection system tape measure protein [Niastella vici]OQP60575.1 hypothetical protein A3860_32695 [Niastella vici]